MVVQFTQDAGIISPPITAPDLDDSICETDGDSRLSWNESSINENKQHYGKIIITNFVFGIRPLLLLVGRVGREGGQVMGHGLIPNVDS